MSKPVPLDLQSLLSWQLALRSERKSPATLKVYIDGITGFRRWCDQTGTPAELSRNAVQAFTADLLDAGAEPARRWTRRSAAQSASDLGIT